MSWKAGEEGEIILDQTTFYPEGGGQVGDVGKLETTHASADVLDTQTPVEGMLVHVVRITKGSFKVGDAIAAGKWIVDKREATNAGIIRPLTCCTDALSRSAGTTRHASGIAGERRSDCGLISNHNAPPTREERERVEDIVNRQILNDIPIQECHMTKDEAAQDRRHDALRRKNDGESVRAIHGFLKYDCNPARTGVEPGALRRDACR